MDKRLAAGEMHKAHPVAFEDVAGEFRFGEGDGWCASLGNSSRAKLQKPQRALQALVIAKWQTPGPPFQTVPSAIFQIGGRFSAVLAI
jgi:hypothetical protein